MLHMMKVVDKLLTGKCGQSETAKVGYSLREPLIIQKIEMKK
jgi:hypothetical protein